MGPVNTMGIPWEWQDIRAILHGISMTVLPTVYVTSLTPVLIDSPQKSEIPDFYHLFSVSTAC